ncbi:MAG: alpha/beta hydrolase [Proteobacteria bacterium]|nr:alpha/beta hydrolase [Pseudomonadota bacterium]
MRPVTHVYKRRGSLELSIDLYLPEGSSVSAPTILYLHGGGWSAGDRTFIEPVALAQVARGYALASADYRLSGTSVWPAQLSDVRAAMLWLRRNTVSFGLDSGMIFAFGVSSGAHLACMLGTAGGEELNEDAEKGGGMATPDGVVALYPPTDFLQARDIGPRFMRAKSPNSPQARLIGAALEQNVERVSSANPVKFVYGSEPPFLLLHGDADCIVDPGQSALLESALAANGSAVTFHRAPGLLHADRRFNGSPWRDRIELFLDDLTTGSNKTESQPCCGD